MATPRYATLTHCGAPTAQPTRATATLTVRPEDKALFDALQAWWHFRHRERIAPEELFARVIESALRNRSGELAGAMDVV